MMPLWKYFFDFFFGGEPLPAAIATLLIKIVAKPEWHFDEVQHLEKCLELNQPIIIHTLSKIKEESD
jgi:hypothetical protein